MSKLPWFKFFPGAWKTDPCLSMCSATTRGVWMDLICAMDQQARKGEISGTVEQLSRIGRCTIQEFITAKDELFTTGTATVKEVGDIIKLTNRRMRKEDKSRADNAKRQERFRENGGGDPERWTYIRAKILLMDEKRCAYCGKKATTVDHVLPRKQGGNEDESNLVACCKVCNCFKNNRTPEQANMTFHTSFNRLNDIVIVGSNGESNTKVTGRSKKLEVRSKKLEVRENTGPAPNLTGSNLFRKPVIPTLAQVKEFFYKQGGNQDQALRFFDKHEATGWYLNGSPIVSWTSLVAGFLSNWKEYEQDAQKEVKPSIYL